MYHVFCVSVCSVTVMYECVLTMSPQIKEHPVAKRVLVKHKSTKAPICVQHSYPEQVHITGSFWYFQRYVFQKLIDIAFRLL